jgi:hypothetical protein
MTQALPTLLAVAAVLCGLVSLTMWWRGHRVAAVRALGAAFGVTLLGSLWAFVTQTLSNRDAAVTPIGVAALVAVMGLALFCFWAAARVGWQRAAFVVGCAANLGVVGFLIYLLVGFKIF